MAFGGELRANTAVDVMVGPFVDETNGKDAETGLTITQVEVRLSKNGGDMAQKAEATSLVHDELGNYVCKFDTADTNTEGILTLAIHESGALPIKMDYAILSEAAWDSKYAAKDAGFMDVNIKTVGRSDIQETEASNLESACSNYSVTRGLTGTAVPAVAADGVGGLPISDAGGLDLDTKLANTNEVTVARMGALTDWINSGRLDALLDTVVAAINTAAMLAAGSTIIQGTIDTTVAATTTEFEADDITEATADHFIGRVILFTTNGVDNRLVGQATDITGYVLNGGRAHFTVTALTEAPINNSTFVIV